MNWKGRETMKSKVFLLVLILTVMCMTPAIVKAEAIGTLEIVSPDNITKTYSQGTDFKVFSNNYATGDVTLDLDWVSGWGYNDDFIGVDADCIVFMPRGVLPYSTKINTASNWFAKGVIIIDNIADNPNWDTLTPELEDPTTIPALLVSNEVGLEINNAWLWGGFVHLAVAEAQPVPTPEPTTMLLLGLGLMGLVGIRRKIKK
jgi:hypothetical protein